MSEFVVPAQASALLPFPRASVALILRLLAAASGREIRDEAVFHVWQNGLDDVDPKVAEAVARKLARSQDGMPTLARFRRAVANELGLLSPPFDETPLPAKAFFTSWRMEDPRAVPYLHPVPRQFFSTRYASPHDEVDRLLHDKAEHRDAGFAYRELAGRWDDHVLGGAIEQTRADLHREREDAAARVAAWVLWSKLFNTAAGVETDPVWRSGLHRSQGIFRFKFHVAWVSERGAPHGFTTSPPILDQPNMRCIEGSPAERSPSSTTGGELWVDDVW